MRTITVCLAVIALVSLSSVSVAQAASPAPLHQVLAEHFALPAEGLASLASSGLSLDETTVACFLVKQGKTDLELVSAQRKSGKSWMDLFDQCGLAAGDVYVYLPDDALKGSPLAKVVQKFRSLELREWKSIKLGDTDLVELVNVMVLSEYFGTSPAEVVKLRTQGKDYSAICDQLRSKQLAKSGS